MLNEHFDLSSVNLSVYISCLFQIIPNVYCQYNFVLNADLIKIDWGLILFIVSVVSVQKQAYSTF